MMLPTPKLGNALPLGNVKIAVIGLGPAGLTAIKVLSEEGFDVVGFERRDRVGGVWSYSPDSSYTSVVQETVSNVSRFVSGFSDFPVPKDLPPYMTGAQVGKFFEAYASHFQLNRHIQFKTTVQRVLRDFADRGWNVHVTRSDGHEEILHFGKVVFGTGSDTVPVWPLMPGREEFSGIVMHGQSYRKPEQFAGQRVLVVGIGNSACEVSLSLTRHTTTVYQSYRRGRIIISRYDDHGVPTDLVPWPSMQFKYMLGHKTPWLATSLANRLMMKTMIHDATRHEPQEPGLSGRERRRRAEKKVKEDWRLVPFPSMEVTHPAVQDDFIAALYSGHVNPVRGFKAFTGANQVLLDDGSTVEVDAVIFCTGYTIDFSLMPELEMDGSCGVPLTTAGQTKILAGDRREPSLPRLYHMMFPPRWASSVAFLSWISALETAWCVCELASTAVAQIWAADTARGLTPLPSERYQKPAQLPSEAKMHASVDEYHAWWRQARVKEPSAHPGFIRPYIFYRFLHDMAGTGMYDHVGHKFSWCNLRLRWKDRNLHKCLSRGPPTSSAWRVFDMNPQGIPGCGRRIWPHAREAVEDAYRDYESYRRGSRRSRQ